ncbi:hypothetical protein [Rummeliibacillus suwonensis]|uniref:hypothetical protein n=1 Tax=Rummeliibacillus suwonensis TaxID=1306154 RepID=UPI001AAE23CA|nr:hypothetical protein [Rummeliibacillus suwonensis]MBO2536296.1 hypothetical protein [Rummeliibacillus suwonensis]
MLERYDFKNHPYSEFKRAVKELTKNKDVPVEQKNEQVTQLVNEYFEIVGKYPYKTQLSNLATWILQDGKIDPHKVMHEEYPVLSKDQIKLRWRREFSNSELDERTNSARHKINGRHKVTKEFED